MQGSRLRFEEPQVDQTTEALPVRTVKRAGTQQVTIGNAVATISNRTDVPRRETTGEVDVKFYLMPNLADPIILGYPDTTRCGMFAEPADDNGRMWVQFFCMEGLRMPVIPPRSMQSAVRAVRAIMVEGPDMRPLEVTISDEDYLDAVE